MQSKIYRKHAPRKSLKGQAVIEMIFSMIMFVVMIAAVASISVYFYLQHAVISSAREGVRTAALNEDIGSDNVAAGEAAVIAQVQDFMTRTTGQNISADNITVTPPDPNDPLGERSVTVQVAFNMQNPIPIEQFLSALTHGGEFGLGSIPVQATATMRYEE